MLTVLQIMLVLLLATFYSNTSLLSAAAETLPDRTPTFSTTHGTATAEELAVAMDIPVDLLVSASLGTSDPTGTHVFTSPHCTSTGFVYPTHKKPTIDPPYSYGYGAAKKYYAYAGWLARGDYNHYLADRYHIGVDIDAPRTTPVYAITDGEIVRVSAVGWGTGNWGVFVRHKLVNGDTFLALYGHVIPDDVNLRYASTKDVNPPVPVKAGVPFAKVGPYGSVDHLHFGIRYPASATDTGGEITIVIDPANPKNNKGSGNMGLNHWPDTNGFVDPIDFIQTKTPLFQPTSTSFVSGFPIKGTSFAVLSSGNAADALSPNTSGGLSTVLGGLNNSQGNDLVQLTLTLKVPSSATHWAVDWRFLSEEYPEWVGSSFNDAFLIETPSSTFTISGTSTIVAPNNVALDPSGNLVTVNTVGVVGMSEANAAGTTYDGGTATLTASAPVPVGSSTITIVFSVMDLGDSIYDTAVFLDNFRFIKPIHIDPIQTYSFYAYVPPEQVQVVFSTSWAGSDVVMTLVDPSGRVIDRNTTAADILHEHGPSFETYTVLSPISGDWQVDLFGADVPPEGEDVVFMVRFSTVPVSLSPSTYKFEYSIPDPIIVATDVDIDVTFMTEEEKDFGYDGVGFRFEADGPGYVIFTATDSEGVEHTFLNNGFWGPSAGFDLPALYEATTTWTLNFLHKAGDYTITFSLVEAPDGDVIADITETVTVTVKPLPAAVTIDPETLNLQAPAKWMTAYIELPEDYDYAAGGIDVNTVRLLYSGNELYADWGDVQDGVFMAKFDWATVAGWFEGLHDEEVELTVAGEVDGVDFEGTDTICVIDPPQRRGGR